MPEQQFNRRELEILKCVCDGVDLSLMEAVRDENDYDADGRWILYDEVTCDPITTLELDQVGMRLYRLIRSGS